MKTKEARFDTRWPEEQKKFFEKASVLGGYRSLSEFVFSAVQQKAEEIVERHEKMILSQKDNEIFIHALLNPPEPNEKLKKAAKRYMDLIEEDEVPNRSIAAES